MYFLAETNGTCKKSQRTKNESCRAMRNNRTNQQASNKLYFTSNLAAGSPLFRSLTAHNRLDPSSSAAVKAIYPQFLVVYGNIGACVADVFAP